MDWAGRMTLDPDTATPGSNDVDGSIVVFNGTDEGDLSPTQVIRIENIVTMILFRRGSSPVWSGSRKQSKSTVSR